MKKFFLIKLLILLLAILISACNKDESPTSGNTNQGTQTQTFTSTPSVPIPIKPLDWTSDSINANISTGINAQNVKDVKLHLNNLEGIIAQNLKFVLFHNNREVFVIDTLMPTSPSPGNMINTILSDSSGAPLISNGNYPYTGVFRPSNPLSAFFNSEASGYWTLRIYNSGSLRTGVIKSWGITITYTPTLQTPTLTNAYLPMLGDNHRFKLCDTNNIDTNMLNLGGENVTWNFENINTQPNEYTDEYVEPILSPLFWHFPISNLAIKNINLTGTRFDFIRSEPYPGTYRYYGWADSNINGLVIKEYIPYLPTYKGNPITYNYISIDSGLTQSSQQGFNANGKFMDTVKANGWGTLKLSGGLTYNNAIKIQISVAEVDTINNFEIRYTLNKKYIWYTVGYKFPVFRVQIILRYSQSQQTIRKEVIYTTGNVPINK